MSFVFIFTFQASFMVLSSRSWNILVKVQTLVCQKLWMNRIAWSLTDPPPCLATASTAVIPPGAHMTTKIQPKQQTEWVKNGSSIEKYSKRFKMSDVEAQANDQYLLFRKLPNQCLCIKLQHKIPRSVTKKAQTACGYLSDHHAHDCPYHQHMLHTQKIGRAMSSPPTLIFSFLFQLHCYFGWNEKDKERKK